MAVTLRPEDYPLPTLRWPDPAALDPEVVRISYYGDLDTLYVRFAGNPESAAEYPMVVRLLPKVDCSERAYMPPPTSVRVLRSDSFERTDRCRIRSY